jgi:hypothetical protein
MSKIVFSSNSIVDLWQSTHREKLEATIVKCLSILPEGACYTMTFEGVEHFIIYEAHGDDVEVLVFVREEAEAHTLTRQGGARATPNGARVRGHHDELQGCRRI